MVPNLLKKALRVNAIFSALCAIDLLLFSRPIANMMGGFDAIYLIFLGIGLVGFAALLLFVSERDTIDLRMAGFITFMDLGWVLGSVLLMIFGTAWLSTTGLVLIAGVAVVVAVCAYFQIKGIYQLIHETPRLKEVPCGTDP